MCGGFLKSNHEFLSCSHQFRRLFLEISSAIEQQQARSPPEDPSPMFEHRRGYDNGNPWYGGPPQPQPAGGRRPRQQPPRAGAGAGAGAGALTGGGRWKDRLRTAAIAAASLCVWYVTPVSQWVTDVLLYQVPVAEDVMLGRQALQDGFAHKYPTVYDRHYTPLLQSIGHDLVRTHRKMHYGNSGSGSNRNQQPNRKNAYSNEWLGDGGRTSQQDPYQWDFAVVKSDSINAFALPGGVVRVTSALLQALHPTSGELAALVGHEMGHVLHRHTQARILQKQLLVNVLQVVVDGSTGGGGDQGYVGGQRGGRRKKTESFGAAVGDVLLQSAQWLGDQKFSRRDEYQADAVAWDLLLASDSYNPQAVISLLSKLERQEQRHVEASAAAEASNVGTASARGITSAIEEWTRTHPATSDRLKALEKKWKDLPAKDRRRLQERRAS
jgi:predicted Zn-dependent protease